MRKPKHYSVLEVLNFSDVGLLFEFYSTKESTFIVDDLTRLTSKNIVLTNETNYNASYSNAILEKEYEATRSRYKLHIAQQNYHSVLPIIDSVTKWISESCETTLDTLLKINLSFNHRHLETLSSISQMDPTRLILKFDENEVYKRFPEQKGSPYALSIKNLAPITNYINESEFENNIKYILTTPYAEFFGINFKEYTRGILECNYIGGKGYAEKPTEIKDILEYLIIKTYQSINEEETNDFEKYEIKRLTEGFNKMQMAFYDPEIFMKEFANLKVYVDLKTSPQTIKTYWNILRKPLFEMIIGGGLRQGTFNYDAQIGRFQLRKGVLRNATLKDMDLVSCELTGIVENCSLVSCNIGKARIYNTKVINNNRIVNSYMEGVSVNRVNEIDKCYILNNDEMINCAITETVVKFATPGKNLTADDKSTVIIKQVPLPVKTDAINIEKTRDYSWIKSMNKKSDDIGYGNLYDKNKYLK